MNYVLHKPRIRVHQRDNDCLLTILTKQRHLGDGPAAYCATQSIYVHLVE